MRARIRWRPGPKGTHAPALRRAAFGCLLFRRRFHLSLPGLAPGHPDYGFQQDISFAIKATPAAAPPASSPTRAIQFSSPPTDHDGKAEPGEHGSSPSRFRTPARGCLLGLATISEDAGKAQYTTITAPTASFGTVSASQSKRNTPPTNSTSPAMRHRARTRSPFPSPPPAARRRSPVHPCVCSKPAGNTTLTYQSHTVDDIAAGNGDHILDRGKRFISPWLSKR